MQMFNMANIGVFQLEAGHNGVEVEFLVFGKPDEVEAAAAVLAPSFDSELKVKRLDAPREEPAADPVEDGPVPACFTMGDPITFLDTNENVRKVGTYWTVDTENPRFAFVRDEEADKMTRASILHIVHA